MKQMMKGKRKNTSLMEQLKQHRRQEDMNNGGGEDS
jgi:hypothetical protein